jgi:uncharacterized repeat protein (TIGR01451 family)
MRSRARIFAAAFAVVTVGLLGTTTASGAASGGKPATPPGRESDVGAEPTTTTTSDAPTTTTTEPTTTTESPKIAADTLTTTTDESGVGPAAAVPPALYAVTGGGCNNSSLYILDPASPGTPILVGAVMLGTTQVVNMTGLAVDPTDGTLYGWMNAQSCGRGGAGTLLTINKDTAAATIVGSEGAGAIQASDLSFDKFGNLFAWSGGCGDANCDSNGSDLYEVDTAAGTTTQVSESGTLGFQTALAVDSTGRMYMKSYQALFRVNQFTGHVFSPAGSNSSLGQARNVMSFGPSDVLYTGTFNPFTLNTLNTTTGALTSLGSTGLSNVSAIEWDLGTPTPPDTGDLHVDLAVNNSTPSVGDDVTFTITLTNDGPDAATNIQVKDKLPSGFSYVSDTPSAGSYSSTTGIWTLASLGSAGSETLEIVADVQAGGNHTNNAEVIAAGAFDTDSTPNSNEGDTFASKRSAPSASAALYSVTGAGPEFCGGSPSVLYELDATTAAPSKVGDITIGGDQVTHVTGLAVDPTTGNLFGFMNFQGSDCALQTGTDGTLLTIDKASGVASMVGSEGDAGIQSPDMTIDPFGNVFGWGENTDDLYSLDTATGVGTLVGDCGCSTSRTGLAFDSLGRLYLKNGDSLKRVNQFTGQTFSSMFFSGLFQNQNMLAFGPGDQPYTGRRDSGGSGNVTFTFNLRTIDISTGVVTSVGTNGLWNTAALAWDRAITAPDQADLSITKTSNNDNPDEWENVTFTITVSNAGPDTATGVQVQDLLPTGLTYVSDDGSGAYNSSTGIWTVGSVADSSSATLHITAFVSPGGGTNARTNVAEVIAAATYDTDSVLGSGEGDTRATRAVTPNPALNPGVNFTPDVIVNGPTKATNTAKSFTVKIMNIGSATGTVSSSDLEASVNGDDGVVSCAPFTATVKGGRSIRVRCDANINALGVSPGDDLTFSATVDALVDGFTNNDTALEVRTAT